MLEVVEVVGQPDFGLCDRLRREIAWLILLINLRPARDAGLHEVAGFVIWQRLGKPPSQAEDVVTRAHERELVSLHTAKLIGRDARAIPSKPLLPEKERPRAFKAVGNKNKRGEDERNSSHHKTADDIYCTLGEGIHDRLVYA